MGCMPGGPVLLMICLCDGFKFLSYDEDKLHLSAGVCFASLILWSYMQYLYKRRICGGLQKALCTIMFCVHPVAAARFKTVALSDYYYYYIHYGS